MNPYKVLGVSKDATDKQIKTAFRKAARAAHPDRGGSSELMDMVHRAYGYIKDPERRRLFDVMGETKEKSDPLVQLRPGEVFLLQRVPGMISNLEPRAFKSRNLIVFIRRAIEEEIDEIDNAIERLEEYRRAYYGAKHRLVSHLDSDNNALQMCLDTAISGIDRGLEKAKSDKAGAEEALGILTEYSYVVDPEPVWEIIS